MRPVLALLLLTCLASGDWNLMPMPSSLAAGQGELAIRPDFRIEIQGYREPRLEAAVSRITARILQLTGMPGVPSTTALTAKVGRASQRTELRPGTEDYGNFPADKTGWIACG